MAFCTEIVCDGCGESLLFNRIVTKGAIVRRARTNGWSVGKYELCPSCRKIRKKLKDEGWIR